MAFHVRQGNYQVGNKVYTLTSGMDEKELKAIVKETPAMDKFITFDEERTAKKSTDDNNKKGGGYGPKSKSK